MLHQRKQTGKQTNTQPLPSSLKQQRLQGRCVRATSSNAWSSAIEAARADYVVVASFDCLRPRFSGSFDSVSNSGSPFASLLGSPIVVCCPAMAQHTIASSQGSRLRATAPEFHPDEGHHPISVGLRYPTLLVGLWTVDPSQDEATLKHFLYEFDFDTCGIIDCTRGTWMIVFPKEYMAQQFVTAFDEAEPDPDLPRAQVVPGEESVSPRDRTVKLRAARWHDFPERLREVWRLHCAKFSGDTGDIAEIRGGGSPWPPRRAITAQKEGYQ